MSDESGTPGTPKPIVAKPPVGIPTRATVTLPIAKFPEDVGWVEANRLPLPVHARRMGIPFDIVEPSGGPNGTQLGSGVAGDYIVTMDGRTVAIVSPSDFKEKYRLKGDAPKPPAPDGSPSAPSTPLTSNQRDDLVKRLDAFAKDASLSVMAQAKNLISELKAIQDAVGTAEVAPLTYACPFCDVTWKDRREAKPHIMMEHVGKSLFG